MSKFDYLFGLIRSFGDTALSFRKNETPEFCLLDTALGSDNAGDEIIMNACEEIIGTIAPHQNPLHIPTHYYDRECEFVKPFLKLLCGTNIIYRSMHGQQQWHLPININSYSNTCLLGVGMSNIGLTGPISAYTRAFFNCILSKRYIHSVRDEQTKSFFNEIGIKNVLNTSCPTTWKLNNDLCAQIPESKGKYVVTTITDYNFDLEFDSIMLDTLRANYESVFVWLQGSHDLDACLSHYQNLSDLILIPRSLKAYDEVLTIPNIDYVGTRLHAGIRALSKKTRSLIISIDNRASSMSQDIGLPILERSNIDQLETIINDKWIPEISLPEKAIDTWISQFK